MDGFQSNYAERKKPDKRSTDYVSTSVKRKRMYHDKNRSVIAWGAVGGGQEGGITKGTGSLEVMVMFIVLTVVRVSEVYTKVKICQVIHCKYMQVILNHQ